MSHITSHVSHVTRVSGITIMPPDTMRDTCHHDVIYHQDVKEYRNGHMSQRRHISHVTCHWSLRCYTSPERHRLPEEAHITMTLHIHPSGRHITSFGLHVTRGSHVTGETSLETSHTTNTKTPNTSTGQVKVRS